MDQAAAAPEGDGLDQLPAGARARHCRPIVPVEQHLQARARWALAQLSPLHRAVVLEVCLRGRTAVEAAAVLDIPVGVLKSRLYHALRAFRECLI
jgi:DNA-directed RNA polymerase specialized sigma24 family protein